MVQPRFKVPYERPTQLSDPFLDFVGYCEELISIPDELLQWHDYQAILGPLLPAGNYEEAVYFLPLAFDFILSNDDGRLDLISALSSASVPSMQNA